MLTKNSTLAEINAAQENAYRRLTAMLGDLEGVLATDWADLAKSDMGGGELGSAFDAVMQGLALEGGIPSDAILEYMREWIDATPGDDRERWDGFYQKITAQMTMNP